MEEKNANTVVTEEQEDELIRTIKMEPILETTELKEEESVTTKKKKIRLTDILLILVIVILIAVLAYIVIKKVL